MRVLLVNKFLYRTGGAENYMINLGTALRNAGNEVQYFGLSSKSNVVGNDYGIYVKSYADKIIINPFSLIYNYDAKKQMKKLLRSYHPDIVHFNNISYHLTSSVIEACKECGVPAVMTIHDPQLVCPNHMLYRPDSQCICNECIETHSFTPCLKHKCLKNSRLKSRVAYYESCKNAHQSYYGYLSKLICPSQFMVDKLVSGGYPLSKTVLIRNFYDYPKQRVRCKKDDYILYFGRLSEEKGVELLCDSIPEQAKLVIAGTGPLENKLKAIHKDNVNFVGFKSGQELQQLISHALFSIYPSKWYENSPLSIIESLSLGTPVIGTNDGGIPELIDEGINGLLFENGNSKDLRRQITTLLDNGDLLAKMSENCLDYHKAPSVNEYLSSIIGVYNEAIHHA